MSIDHLTVADVIALHEIVMESTAFAPAPLRDEGSLEAAITRPRMAAYYEEADLVRQAALLAVGISQAQAFLDGNKRTAYAAAESFLLLNGHELTGDPLTLARLLEQIAEALDDRTAAIDRFEQWLREHVRARGT
jgi:death-on-curing protein